MALPEINAVKPNAGLIPAALQLRRKLRKLIGKIKFYCRRTFREYPEVCAAYQTGKAAYPSGYSLIFNSAKISLSGAS